MISIIIRCHNLVILVFVHCIIRFFVIVFSVPKSVASDTLWFFLFCFFLSSCWTTLWCIFAFISKMFCITCSYCCQEPHITSIEQWTPCMESISFISCIFSFSLPHTCWTVGVWGTWWGVSCNGLLTVEAWTARDADLWAWVGLILSCGTWQGHRRARGTVVTLKTYSSWVYLLSFDWCERIMRWKHLCNLGTEEGMGCRRGEISRAVEACGTGATGSNKTFTGTVVSCWTGETAVYRIATCWKKYWIELFCFWLLAHLLIIV